MTIRCQITLNPSSQLPRDRVTNTLHYDWITSRTAATAAVNLAVEAFYETIDSKLSALLTQNGHDIKHFDLDDAPPRAPYNTYPFNFDTAPSATRLPGEVACVISTRAAAQSGINPGSLRNRFFIGPLAGASVAATGFITTTWVEEFADAAQTMFNAINASGDAEAVIYSPTLDTTFPMQTVWVNNEFDIQRRRGTIETLREERGITPA